MRLGIDLDGVVADFNAGWMELYNEEFGTNLTPDLVDHWDAIPDLTHFADMGEFWHWASDLDGASLFRHLRPYPGAVEALDRLAVSHDVVIITTKPDFAVHDTYQWISQHRLPTTEVHITERKWEVACDVYLDDGPHVLRGLARFRPDAVVCRYVRPWNHDLAGTVAVIDFADFERVVADLAT